jgi:hypothetical protein
MSKTLKWILGIVLVLALVGGMFAIGYFWQSRAYGMMPGLPGQFERVAPSFGARGWQHPMMRDRGGYSPMMHGGYYPMAGGFFLLGGFVKFALFLGLLYGAYWLGRRNARIALDPSTGSGQSPPPGAPVSSPPPPPTNSAQG